MADREACALVHFRFLFGGGPVSARKKYPTKAGCHRSLGAHISKVKSVMFGAQMYRQGCPDYGQFAQRKVIGCSQGVAWLSLLYGTWVLLFLGQSRVISVFSTTDPPL